MPIITDQLPDRRQLNAELEEIAQKFDILGDHFVRLCDRISRTVRSVRATVDADLQRGVEARQFASGLARYRVFTTDVLEV